MNVNNFFDMLAQDASRNYKIEQLQLNSDNGLLKEIVRLALDPMTQFYQRKIPEYTTGKGSMNLEQGLKRLFPLCSRMVTGNAAIAHLTETLSQLSADDAKVIERIIEKDLRCGVSIATANKVWPKLVMDYPCMLCSQFEQKLVDKIKFPAIVQTKMDGMRFNAIVKDGLVEFRSRNGKELFITGDLEKEFLVLAKDHDFVFDGELLVKQNGSIVDRQTGNGILNKANKGTIDKHEMELICATVWDIIPYNDFLLGKCTQKYEDRWNYLCVLYDTFQPEKMGLVDNWIVHNMTEVNTLFQGLLNQGQEGIILKDLNGVWENKRTKTQIKFKGELECELRIVGLQPGTGKYENMLGALLCESEDKKIQVSVGSGFNDEQRSTLSTDIIGKVVSVKYNSRITNKQGEESLFLPIFVEIREDKTEADFSKDIK